jgi:hypothetical protein
MMAAICSRRHVPSRPSAISGLWFAWPAFARTRRPACWAADREVRLKPVHNLPWATETFGIIIGDFQFQRFPLPTSPFRKYRGYPSTRYHSNLPPNSFVARGKRDSSSWLTLSITVKTTSQGSTRNQFCVNRRPASGGGPRLT